MPIIPKSSHAEVPPGASAALCRIAQREGGAWAYARSMPSSPSIWTLATVLLTLAAVAWNSFARVKPVPTTQHLRA